MKLGLVIYITSGGRERHSGFNEGEWTRHVPDVREALQLTFPGQEDLARAGRQGAEAFSGSGGVVYMVSFTAAGAMFTIIKASVGGRANDNTAATIFIPTGTQIDGLATLRLVNEVQKVISHPTGIDVGALGTLMAREYPAGEAPAPVVSALNRTFAVVRYGGNSPLTLENLLGQSLYQPVYAAYQAVFMIDASRHYELFGTVQQIPDSKITSIISVFPPKGNFNGFQPYVNGKLFNREILVARGSTVTVVWTRQGYAPVEKSFQALDATSAQKAAPQPFDLKVRIPRNAITVVNPKGTVISQASVTLNGQPFRDGYVEIHEAALTAGVTVDVSADGYKSARIKINSPRPQTVTLNRNVVEREYKIMARDLNDEDVKAQIIVRSYRNLSRSPLRGYANDGRDRLEYVGDGMSKFLWGICGLGVGLFIWLVVAWAIPTVSGWFGGKEKTEQVVDQPTEEETPTDQKQAGPTEQDWENACEYLDKNTTWRKEEMENSFNGCLKGLFDDLNNFDEVKLQGEWKTNLAGSKKFQEIMDAWVTGPGAGCNTFEEVLRGKNEIGQNDVIERMDRKFYYFWVSQPEGGKKFELPATPPSQSVNTSDRNHQRNRVTGKDGSKDKTTGTESKNEKKTEEEKLPGTITIKREKRK